MLSKISLVASTLGLTVAGTGADMTQTPLHITQTDLAAAYSFDTVEECRVKVQSLYDINPHLAGKLKCVS